MRHKRGPTGGPSFTYGYRLPTIWFQSGEAQTLLLPPELRPRPAMIGVTGKYAYQVTSPCLRADMPEYELADLLMKITQEN